MFSKDEKEYLRKIVEREIKNLKEEEKLAGSTELTPAFLKGEAEYEEFLKGIAEKLK